jgi:hypothetical protein
LPILLPEHSVFVVFFLTFSPSCGPTLACFLLGLMPVSPRGSLGVTLVRPRQPEAPQFPRIGLESSLFPLHRPQVSPFDIEPFCGQLLPLGECRVTITLEASQCQRLQTVLELEVENGSGRYSWVVAQGRTAGWWHRGGQQQTLSKPRL